MVLEHMGNIIKLKCKHIKTLQRYSHEQNNIVVALIIAIKQLRNTFKLKPGVD